MTDGKQIELARVNGCAHHCAAPAAYGRLSPDRMVHVAERHRYSGARSDVNRNNMTHGNAACLPIRFHIICPEYGSVLLIQGALKTEVIKDEYRYLLPERR